MTSRQDPVGAPRTSAGGAGSGPDEFERLIASTLEVAYRVALQVTGDAAQAETAVHDTALSAYLRRGAYRPGARFRTWFLRLLSARLEADSNLLFTAGPLEAGEPSAVSREAAARHALPEIRHALGVLPYDVRIATALDLAGDFRHEEIASVLGVPVEAARARIHCGRALLRQVLRGADSSRHASGFAPVRAAAELPGARSGAGMTLRA